MAKKRLIPALAEKEKAMKALQDEEDKIVAQRRELEEHQHELDTWQAKIVSASNATSMTNLQEDSMGMTPPIRNMLTNFLAALKSGVPMESTEMIAAFESIRLQQASDNMDSANQEDEETPMATWTTVGRITQRRRS